MIMSAHALYRFFDAGGDLLYVGVTSDPGRRWGRHANDKPWWHEVDRIEIERYPDRETVLAAERKAIQDEHPRYNVVHVQPLAPPTRVLVEDRPAAGACECGDPATILYVLYRDIAEHTSDMKAWKAEHGSKFALTGTDLFSMPDQVPWRAACDRHPPEEGGPYEIPHPTSWRDWAARTAHLLEKDWFPKTNWSSLLYGAGAAGPENLTERTST
jgi:GIY-YIG catalytic domain-containing protein